MGSQISGVSSAVKSLQPPERFDLWVLYMTGHFWYFFPLQPATRTDADSVPTHLRPFTSEAEYKLVKSTYHQLLHSGYYWGPMTMEEAHEILKQTPTGTFLIR